MVSETLSSSELASLVQELEYFLSFPKLLSASLEDLCLVGAEKRYSYTSCNYSLIKLLGECAALQLSLLDVVFGRLLLVSAADSKASEVTYKLVLQQLRWLERIPDQLTFASKVLSFLDAACDEMDKTSTAVSYLPEIVPNAMHNMAADWLLELLKSKPRLLLPVIDSLCSLSLDSEHSERISAQLCDSIARYNLEELPVVLKFLLLGNMNSPATVKRSTELVLSSLRLEDLVEDCSSKWLVLLQVVMVSLNSSSNLQSLILQLCSSSDTTLSAFELICLLSIPNAMKKVEKVFVKRLANKRLHPKTLTFVVERFATISSDLAASLIGLASSLIESSTATHLGFKRTGNAMASICIIIYEKLIECLAWKEATPIVHALVAHIGSGQPTQMNAALQCLDKVASKSAEKLSPFIFSLKTLIDSIPIFSLDQVFVLFSVLSRLGLVCQPGLVDELFILVRKWLTVSLHKGCMAGLALFLESAAFEPHAEDANKVFDALYSGCKSVPLFYDELAERLPSAKRLNPQLLKNIQESLTDEFTTQFCWTSEVVDEHNAEHPLEKLEIVDHLDGLESSTCVRIGGRDDGLLSLGILTSSFKLLAAISTAQGDTDLEALDALLGAGIVWDGCDENASGASGDVHDNDGACVSYKRAECLYHTVCWYKECVNVFSACPSSKAKVLKRVESLPSLLSSLSDYVGSNLNVASVSGNFNIFNGVSSLSQLLPYCRHFRLETLSSLLQETELQVPTVELLLREWNDLVGRVLEVLCVQKHSYHFLSESTAQTPLSCPTGSLSGYSGGPYATSLQASKKRARNSKGGIWTNELSNILREMNSATTWARISSSCILEYVWSPLENLVGMLLSENHATELDLTLVGECLTASFAIPADAKRLSMDITALLVERVVTFLNSQSTASAKVIVLLLCSLVSLEKQLANSEILTAVDLSRLWDNFWDAPDWDDWASLKVGISKHVPNLTSLVPLFYYYSTNPLLRMEAFLKRFQDHKQSVNEGEESAELPIYMKDDTEFLIYRASFQTLVQTLSKICDAKFGALDEDGTILSSGSGGDFTVQSVLKRFPPAYRPSKEALKDDALELFALCTRLFSELLNGVRYFEGNKVVLQHSMRYGRQFVDLVRQQVIPKFLKPLLTLNSGAEGIPIAQRLLRNVQMGTRQLQIVCGHAKASKDASLTTQVPALRKSLEALVYEVKLILEEGNCLDAFWVGNLKHKSLQGEILQSQLPLHVYDESKVAPPALSEQIVDVGAGTDAEEAANDDSQSTCPNTENCEDQENTNGNCETASFPISKDQTNNESELRYQQSLKRRKI